ncbi:MAG: acyl carrier protein [Anaerolineales bacterium]|nr:acyl carrier protein [Anaerolineales bacterium]
MTNEIISKLNTYITGEIMRQPDRTLAPTEPLISTGLVDSFSLVDLALFIEEEFGVHIDDTELNQDTFDTLQELAKLIEDRR